MTAEAQGVGRSREPIDLQALIETIPALVVCALTDGSAEFANRAWHEYTGCSSPELTLGLARSDPPWRPSEIHSRMDCGHGRWQAVRD